MFNINIGQLLFMLTFMTISPGRDSIIVPSWIVIVIFILILVLLIVTINTGRRNRDDKTIIKNEEHNNKILSENYKKLEAKHKDITNENLKLTNQNDEFKENNEKLKKLAYYDNLTSLPNKLPFMELLDSVMLTLREDETAYLLVLNVDNLKIVNSQLGNSYGDELLIDVTHRLKQVINENDYLARIDGDEFAILTQNISDSIEYEDKLKRILNVFSYPFALSLEEKFISVSIGIAIAPKDGENSSTLFKNAKVALRNAKASGKDTYVYFEESMNDAITKKIQAQSELRKGFEENEFELHYEPIVSLEDNKLKAFEALICWNHPTNGLMHPDEFMVYTNETGLIVPIGVWALKAACKQLKYWQDNGYSDVKLFFKISSLKFKDPEFVSIIWDVVTKSEIDPSRFVIQISEETVIDAPELTITTIDKLGELGVRFCLNQFGSNYSSIKYLNRLNLSYVKLDKNLTRSAALNVESQNIVEAIIRLINLFDFGIIVEEINSEFVERFFKHVKCVMAKGPLYTEMVSAEETDKLLEIGYIKSNYDEEEVNKIIDNNNINEQNNTRKN